MLVCPKCNFENPDLNKFCQSCGTSLTHKHCPQCATKVVFEEQTCPNCGAVTGKILWAIVVETAGGETETFAQPALASVSIDNRVESIAEMESNNQTITSIATNEEKTQPSEIIYLDPKEKRYRLVDELQSLKIADTKGCQGLVIDSQPLQKTVIASISSSSSASLADKQETNEQLWQRFQVPQIALPYLKLQQFLPLIPEIYDTWQEENQEIILLADRSQWELFSDLLANKTLPLLQLVWSLGEILQMWEPLAQIGCVQSLLEPSNLRVDEDQSLYLQFLYPNLKEQIPTLVDLAKLWLDWLNFQSSDCQPLQQVLQQVIEGQITSTQELINNLQTIAESMEENNDSELQSKEKLDVVDTPEEISLNDIEEENSLVYNNETDEAPTMMVQMDLLSITDAGFTEIGRQRNHNEDFFNIFSQSKKQENAAGKIIRGKGLYIVCDGMGGHAAGEVASALATETLINYFDKYWQEELPDEEIIYEAILTANQKLYEINTQNARSGSGRMGTTLVMALVHDTKLAIAHVGDSRIYRVTRKYGLEQLTSDHEVGQREIQKGIEPEIAYARPDAYQLTQALGPRDRNYVKPDIQFLDLEEDCLLLLCSDGLCDNDLVEHHFSTYLTPLISSSANLDNGLIELIDFANDYNGHDNITGIIVRIKLKAHVDR